MVIMPSIEYFASATEKDIGAVACYSVDVRAKRMLETYVPVVRSNMEEMMNRAERRAASKPQKSTPPRGTNRPNLAQIQGVFGHIDVMLEGLARTHQVQTVRGIPVMSDGQGDLHVIHSAILGWCDLWKKLAERFKFSIDLKPLERMAQYLEHGTPLSLDMVHNAQKAIDRCRAIYARLDVVEVGRIVTQQCRDLEIAELLRKQAKNN